MPGKKNKLGGKGGGVSVVVVPNTKAPQRKPVKITALVNKLVGASKQSGGKQPKKKKSGKLQELRSALYNKVSGHGDYVLGGDPNQNSLFKMDARGNMMDGNALQTPVFGNPHEGTELVHRELFGLLKVPSNPESFTMQKFIVNPGNASLMPWLADIAQRFEQYQFLGIVFEYESRTSSFSSVPAMGSVTITAQYNVTQEQPQTIIEMKNTAEAISARPDRNILYGLECENPAMRKLNIRNPTAEVIDPHLFDIANLFIATEGLPDNYVSGTVMGELYVSFHLRLFEPLYKLPPTGSFIFTSSRALARMSSNNDYLSGFNQGVSGNTEPAAFYGTGRFTPYSLDGTSTPLLSYGGVLIDGGSSIQGFTETTELNYVNASEIHFAPFNLSQGMSILCTISVAALRSEMAYIGPVYGSVTGSPIVNVATPIFKLLSGNNIIIQDYNDDGDVIMDLPNSGLSAASCSAISSSFNSNVVGSGSDLHQSWTYSFYMTITGVRPHLSFIFTNAASSVDVAEPTDGIPVSFMTKTGTQEVGWCVGFSGHIISNTGTNGRPKYVDYVVPVVPTFPTSIMAVGDSAHRDARIRGENTSILENLATMHGAKRELNSAMVDMAKFRAESRDLPRRSRVSEIEDDYLDEHERSLSIGTRADARYDDGMTSKSSKSSNIKPVPSPRSASGTGGN